MLKRAVCKTCPQGFPLLGQWQASCGPSGTACTRAQGHEKPVYSEHGRSGREVECGEKGQVGQDARADEGSGEITEASDSTAVSNLGSFGCKPRKQARQVGLNQRAHRTNKGTKETKEASCLE